MRETCSFQNITTSDEQLPQQQRLPWHSHQRANSHMPASLNNAVVDRQEHSREPLVRWPLVSVIAMWLPVLLAKYLMIGVPLRRMKQHG